MPRHYTPEEIKAALVQTLNSEPDALDELIATGEAVFSLLSQTELEEDVKNAFYQLEKQFMFYAALAGKG